MSKFGTGLLTGVIGTLVVQGILIVVAGKSLTRREKELPVEPEVGDGYVPSPTVDQEVVEELKKYFGVTPDENNVSSINGEPYVPTVDEILDEEDDGPSFVFEE